MLPGVRNSYLAYGPGSDTYVTEFEIGAGKLVLGCPAVGGAPKLAVLDVKEVDGDVSVALYCASGA